MHSRVAHAGWDKRWALPRFLVVIVLYFDALSAWKWGWAARNVEVRRAKTGDRRRKSNARGRRLQRQATWAPSLHFRRKPRDRLRPVQRQIRLLHTERSGHVHATLPRYYSDQNNSIPDYSLKLLLSIIWKKQNEKSILQSYRTEILHFACSLWWLVDVLYSPCCISWCYWK